MADELAALIVDAATRTDHPLRVALDGPACAQPFDLAVEISERLRAAGLGAAVISDRSFWRDASVRLEYGREDIDSYFEGWLDGAALTREVLGPLGPGGSFQFLPALRDPASNRSVRADRLPLVTPAAVIVAGDLLLGRGLAFDLSIHLALSPAARERRTAAADRWTLAALDRYDDAVAPVELADVVVSWNDPARPALRTQP